MNGQDHPGALLGAWYKNKYPENSWQNCDKSSEIRCEIKRGEAQADVTKTNLGIGESGAENFVRTSAWVRNSGRLKSLLRVQLTNPTERRWREEAKAANGDLCWPRVTF